MAHWLNGPMTQSQSALAQRLVDHLAGHDRGGLGIADHIRHLARYHLVLRDAAGLPRVGAHQRPGAAPEPPGAPRRHQDVAIVAVESVHQLHFRYLEGLPRPVGAESAKEARMGSSLLRILSWRHSSAVAAVR